MEGWKDFLSFCSDKIVTRTFFTLLKTASLSLFLVLTGNDDSLSPLSTFNLNVQSTMVSICTTCWYSHNGHR
jgi:hypothetical protein